MTEKSIAILTLKETNKMTLSGRKEIADWLKNQADNIIKDGGNYADLFRARFIVTSD